MSAVQYPFIDIAVHEEVREHFARGEALALFSMDLTSALWANGRGAALFGEALIYDFLDKGPQANDVTFRQLASAATRLNKTGDEQRFTIRVTSGFRSQAVTASAKIIEAEAGAPAILFSAFIDQHEPSFDERAKRMIEGFDDPDIHMAVLNGDGTMVAASNRFPFLGITEKTTQTLISLGNRQSGSLVKRPLLTGKGYLPAASGKLQDSPELHLLFVIETILGQLDPVAEAPSSQVAAAQPATDDDARAKEPFIEAISAIADIAEIDSSPAPDELTEDFVPLEVTESLIEIERRAEREPEIETAASHDASPQAIEHPTKALPFVFNPSTRASRFVWKIDADGRFSAMSSEFTETVGPVSASVVGMKFTDIDMLFDLDPEGKIAEALTRRDTWSGKTIYWPVENTTLKVPIDLAALPTYTRAREFDGFRGFGIVRSSDAVEDPNALGMLLADIFKAEREEPTKSEPVGLPDSVTVQDIAASGPDIEIAPLPEAPAAPLPAQSKPRGALSAAEQAAFREIARKLAPIETPAAAEPVASTTQIDAEAEIETEAEAETAADVTLIQTPLAAEPEVIAEATPAPITTFSTEDTFSGDLFAQLEAGAVPAGAAEDFKEIEVVEQAETVRVTESVDEPEVLAEAEAEAEASAPPASALGKDILTPEIVDQMPVALLIQVDNRLTHANAEFLKLTGYETIDELIDVGGLDGLLQRDDLDSVADNPGGMLAVTADNELIPVKARLQSVKWLDRSALMLSLVPVAEIVQASSGLEAAAAQVANNNQAASLEAIAPSILEEEVEELRSILETATDGVVLLGDDGTIRSLNRSASALFNYDNSEIAGKPFVNLFAHESQRAVLDYLSGLANNGVVSVLNDGREVIGREINGGFIPLFMTIGQLKASNGYCAVIRDITQWKRTEEDLRNAKRSAETANAHKTEFLARVSHEIRTPLNAIIGFSDIMATERFGPVGHPRYVEYANDIGRSGRHVLDIVNDLLDISKIEAGQMDVEFTAVALNETIAEAVSIIQPQANNQRVIIRTSLSRSVPQIVADLRSIKQIVLNILSNAIRFTPSGGQIVVSTSYEANGSVTLRIRDTGIGMTRAELDHAMKPFRQVSSSTKRVRGDGTGLGLPLTKAMVDANRADFAISSTPNEGTLVEISFPSQRVLAN